MLHHVNLEKSFQKTPHIAFKRTSDWLQNWCPWTFGSRTLLWSILGVPGALKLTARKTHNLKKSRPMPTQKHKNMKMSLISEQLVPCFFIVCFCGHSAAVREAKSSEKHCRVVRNRRIHFFRRNHILCRKIDPRASQNDPRHTPRNPDGPIWEGF